MKTNTGGDSRLFDWSNTNTTTKLFYFGTQFYNFKKFPRNFRKLLFYFGTAIVFKYLLIIILINPTILNMVGLFVSYG